MNQAYIDPDSIKNNGNQPHILLETKRLCKTYGSSGVTYPALSDFDLTIYAGEFCAIMGPSGSGKTTLLNLMATIDRPSSGTVVMEGTDIASLKSAALSDFRREKLGFIFQDFNLLDTLSVEENIALPLSLGGMKPAEQEKRAQEAARTLGISDVLDKRPYELSGGQKQRCAAARAIAGKPSLILADEPTGNLDSRSARELLTSLSTLNQNQGTTILMVTHDAFSASYSSRVVFIKDGRRYSELRKGSESGEFFDRILDTLKALEGGSHA